MRTTRAVIAPALVLGALLLAPQPVFAHPGEGGVSKEGVIAPGSDGSKQHDGTTGHLPAVRHNVDLVGRADINGAGEGRVADVAAFGQTAYLTVRDPKGCSDAGVAIMDISDPVKPVQTGFIESTEGSFPGEGAQVLDVRSSSFRGQVLLFNNEICGPNGRGGASLWDVTDPANPAPLTEHAGDSTRSGDDNPALNDIHSVLGWTDGRKAYAVLVDNAERSDVDILDISDPRAPVLISETNLNDVGVLQKQATPLGGNSFLHDIEVQLIDGTMTMLASYWDGGWTLLDVDDPAEPKYLRDFDYSAVDAKTGLRTSEGNAHQAEFSPNGRLIVGTDEDFDPYRLTVSSQGVDYQAAQGSDTPQLDADTRLSGPTTYVGQTCTASDVPPASGAGQIAVTERGTCTFTEKARNAEAAGYDGMILVNAVRPDGCNAIVTPSVQAGIPVVSVGRDTGAALLGLPYDEPACLAGGPDAAFQLPAGASGAPVDVAAIFDGWGYVRLLDSKTMKEIDTYAIDEALDPAYAEGFGDLSVHEVAMDPRRHGLAYLSYYSGGLRVVRYGRDGLREVGAYIDEGGNNFWGVEHHTLPSGKGRGSRRDRELILASDRDTGLWIFSYTGGR